MLIIAENDMLNLSQKSHSKSRNEIRNRDLLQTFPSLERNVRDKVILKFLERGGSFPWPLISRINSHRGRGGSWPERGHMWW